MSDKVITGNDLKAILGEVLPASQGVFCELIWTNPNGHTNLTCTMGESTITINKHLSNYSGFIIEFRNYYNTGEKTTEIYFSKCQGMYGRTIISATLSNPTISYGRHWYPVAASNGFYFSDCTRYSSNAASVVGSDTGCLVPMRIYGFKLYGTSKQALEVADYVIDKNTDSNGWEYTKWYSGKMTAEKDLTTGSTWTTVASPVAHNQTTITPPTGMTVTSGYANLKQSSAYVIGLEIQVGATIYLEAFRLSTGSASFQVHVTLIGTTS